MDVLLEMLKDNWIAIVGWLVAIVNVGIISALWNVIKKGRGAFDYFQSAKTDGWTDKEKDTYIEKSGKFWNALKGFWSTVKAAFKKWF